MVGPFLWLSPTGSPFGFRELPPGGMCLSAFVFLERDGSLLVGKYADHAAWDTLAGLDHSRRLAHGGGWTLPATHLKFGEDPRDAARRVVLDILQIPGAALSEPRVETEFGRSVRFPEMGDHYDVWFFFEAHAAGWDRGSPPAWWADLAWVPIAELAEHTMARGHHDVLERWRAARERPIRA